MLSEISSIEITSIILVLGVIYVNGLTDAPNAIATCVTTRCLSVRWAVVLSSLFNFIGVFWGGRFGASVVNTIMEMVDFGADENIKIIGLCGGMVSIVLWAVLAWYFGIPTSESHALIAGLTGAAVAVSGGFCGVNSHQWFKAVYGLFISCIVGFLLGFLICRGIVAIFRNMGRRRVDKIFRFGQIFAAAFMSFMHGAQDGQKFLGVLLLCIGGTRAFNERTKAIVICSVIMALGTLSGGKRIIKSVGMDMVRLERYQGFSADIAGATSLLVSTLFGLPVSTTHAKTVAMVGCAVAGNKRSVNISVIMDMAKAWIFTFPGCGLLGFGVTEIFLRIF